MKHKKPCVVVERRRGQSTKIFIIAYGRKIQIDPPPKRRGLIL